MARRRRGRRRRTADSGAACEAAGRSQASPDQPGNQEDQAPEGQARRKDETEGPSSRPARGSVGRRLGRVILKLTGAGTLAQSRSARSPLSAPRSSVTARLGQRGYHRLGKTSRHAPTPVGNGRFSAEIKAGSRSCLSAFDRIATLLHSEKYHRQVLMPFEI